MDRKQFDVALPMFYALLLVVCALYVHKALGPVAIIGAMLLGIYYAAFRNTRQNESGGRNRNRNRDRDR